MPFATGILRPRTPEQRDRQSLTTAVVASIVAHLSVVALLVVIASFSRRPDRIGLSSAGLTPEPESILTLVPAPPSVNEPIVDPPPAIEPEIATTPTVAPVAEPVMEPTPTPEALRLDPPAPVALPPARPTSETPVHSAPATAPAPTTPTIESPSPVPPRPSVSYADGDATPASKVVYVLDASGSMANSLAFAVDELKKSVRQLGEDQSFQVVVSHGPDQPVAVFPTHGLVAPTRDTMASLASWLNRVQLVGRSDPLPGLREALRVKPDLVLILTQSIKRSGSDANWGAGNEQTLGELDSLNPRNFATRQRPVVIKAIQFVDDDPTGLLQAIAEQHGDGEGSYRVVNRRPK
ncbi:MAG: hypothetical protein IPK69_08220 [Phycisphaerales bacterium]|nr:MAG: hypothetical protein IPK69_08220 [Phycisphaerales bacterium]